jgi:hypothetical protein
MISKKCAKECNRVSVLQWVEPGIVPYRADASADVEARMAELGACNADWGFCKMYR